MPRTVSTTKGECQLCGSLIAKSSMTNHLKSCRLKNPPKDATKKTGQVLHVVVQEIYGGPYFLHLEADASWTLYDLDAYLRRIWLECCGHMSEFVIGNVHYDVMGEDLGFGFSDLAGVQSSDMDVKLGRVLRPKTKFSYTYDFGSSTKLKLHVAGSYEAPLPKDGIRLLARNAPPEIPCGICSKPATKICSFCSYDAEGWLCDKCFRQHECGDEGELPVVNSPRTGVCAYMA